MITGNSTSAESCFLKTCRSVRVEALRERIGPTYINVYIIILYLLTYIHVSLHAVCKVLYIVCVQQAAVEPERMDQCGYIVVDICQYTVCFHMWNIST